MGLAMVTPTRKKTGQWVTRKAIPAAVRAAYGKSEEIRWWPATLTEGQVKAECAAWLAPIEDRIAYLKSQQGAAPLSLTKRQCVALAGEWYQAKAAAEESHFTDSNVTWDWDGEIDAILPYGGDDGLESQPLRPIQTIVDARDALLRERQLAVTPDSAERLLQEMLARYLDFLKLMQRRHAGDFGPDPVLGMLPEGDAFAPAKTKESPAISIAALFERYAVSGSANAKTVHKWRSRVASLIDHLGHDDAGRVTRADMNGWTAALVAKGLAKKTIVDGYLPAVRAAFAIAYEDRAIAENPAAGLKVRAPKAVKLRERDHTDEEANTILRAALGPQPPGLADHHARARRWVPWLCAYTGARVAEMTQLRAMDIQQEWGIWYVLVTPEAGSTKNNEARKVPLHSHLIEQGFVQLAKEGDATPLFYRQGAGNEVNPGYKIRASNLAQWVRSLGIETPQPNHGWRHRFKTISRAEGIPEDTVEKIQAHVPTSQSRKYGRALLVTMKEAIEKLPKYQIDAESQAI